MALSQEMQTVLSRIDTFSTQVGGEVSAVAARITDLISKIGTGMTQADVDSVVGTLGTDATALEAAGAALTALASDPNNPTPSPTPPPAPAP